jgi:hypothetical protein
LVQVAACAAIVVQCTADLVCVVVQACSEHMQISGEAKAGSQCWRMCRLAHVQAS